MQRIWCSLLLLLAVTVTLRPLSASILAANITSNISVPDVWTYSVVNQEPAGNSNYISEFDVVINASVTVTAEPTGWTYEIGACSNTPSNTCVKFESTDLTTDLAPGNSLSGFSISSPGSTDVLANAIAYSWDHNANDAGPATSTIQVDSPLASGDAQVPEPWTGSTVGLALLVGSFWLRKKSRRGQRLTAI